MHLLVASVFLVALVSSVYGRINAFSFNTSGEPHSGYYISLTIGTPPQDAKLLVDSGSSNLAIAVGSNNSNLFDYNRSASFIAENQLITVRYTEGSWSGFLAKDVAHLCNDPSCAVLIQFACITSSERVFEEDTRWNGILGLAYGSIAKPTNLVEPFFDTLVTYNTSNIFSLSLCGPFLHSDELVSTSGKLHLGYLDNQFYDGNVVYTPVVKEWYYEVLIAGVEVGEDILRMSCSQINDHRFIVDSGTSLLAFPVEIYWWIVDQIKERIEPFGYEFPDAFWTEQSLQCIKDNGVLNKFPAVIISLYHGANSTFSLVITPELYLLKISKPSTDWQCLKLAMVAVDDSKPAVIGATVLKGFYVIFDRENKRVGFANATCRALSELAPGSIPFVTQPNFISENIIDCDFEDIQVQRYSSVIYFLVGLAIFFSLPMVYVFVSWLFRKLVGLRKRSQLLRKNNIVYSIFH